PRPVDAAIHVWTRRATVNHVKDLLAFVAHVQNVRVTNLPQIMWLPARSGIESRAVKKQSPCGPRNPAPHIRRKHFAMENPRGELLQKRIVVVKPPCGHLYDCPHFLA